ncbi:hypothetical protein D9M71_193750 [compost metagenome]
MLEAQAQHLFQYADRLHLIGIDVLHLSPVLAISGGPIPMPAIEQAVVAIGLFQRQGQQQGSCLAVTGLQARQVETGGQPIYMIAVDQGTVRHAQLQPSGLERAQAQSFQVEGDTVNAPRVHQAQTSQALVGPGLPARLLLELLRGQQGPRGPQGAVDFHEVVSCEVA